jgi:glutaminyl-peptide cyclotransferase
LNGIAYLPSTGRLLLTGKLWPRIFEVELIPVAAPTAR